MFVGLVAQYLWKLCHVACFRRLKLIEVIIISQCKIRNISLLWNSFNWMSQHRIYFWLDIYNHQGIPCTQRCVFSRKTSITSTIVRVSLQNIFLTYFTTSKYLNQSLVYSINRDIRVWIIAFSDLFPPSSATVKKFQKYFNSSKCTVRYFSILRIVFSSQQSEIASFY